MTWVPCHKCGYWLDKDNEENREHGIVMVKGEIKGILCPTCTHKVPPMERHQTVRQE